MASGFREAIPKFGGADLEVTNLSVSYLVQQTKFNALDSVSLSATRGSAVGVVGESGCGKSTFAWSILRSLPHNAQVEGGEVLLDGVDILSMSEEDFGSKIRWKELALIPQASMNMFNPVFSIDEQIAETISVHLGLSIKESRERAKSLLRSVGIDLRPNGLYPHQLSGGMKQRAAIAMALALSPKILVADEPTTALDVIVQCQIMTLLDDLRRNTAMTLVLISHDVSLITQYTDTVVVMYAGRVVEAASTKELIKKPLHPYTSALLKSIPSIRGPKIRLKGIPGSPPNLSMNIQGCRFAARCAFVQEECRLREPPLEEVESNHFVACFMWYKLVEPRNL